MNEDGTLSKKEMRQVSKLNVYLRDKCGVPFSDAFHIAMLIVKNRENIVDILNGEESE